MKNWNRIIVSYKINQNTLQQFPSISNSLVTVWIPVSV